MKTIILLVFLTLPALASASGDEPPNTRQYYSGKFGYYQPGEGLNNGLLIGLDGITEFVHYNIFLSGAVDFYPKQSISIFKDPQPNGNKPPDVSQQQMLLFPIHINF